MKTVKPSLYVENKADKYNSCIHSKSGYCEHEKVKLRIRHCCRAIRIEYRPAYVVACEVDL
jgi:hypothetical protein